MVEANHRRVIVMSMGFFGIFMAFNTAQALATSTSGNLGNVCLATLYITFAFACVAAPKYVDQLGPRLSMILGSLPYVGMILANLQPSYYLSVPMNFLVGLGAPLLWTGEGVYVGQCALKYAKDQKVAKETATSEFNALFFSFFQANGVVGLVVSSIILSVISGDAARNILFLVMGVVAACGVGVLFLVRPVESPHDKGEVGSRGIINVSGRKNKTENGRGSMDGRDRSMDAPFLEKPGSTEDGPLPSVSLYQTLKLAFGDKKMALMIPIIFYNGLSLGFMFGDYSAGVSTKALGVSYTGFVLAAFYGANTIVTSIFGKLAGGCCGRRGLVYMAAGIHTLFYILFLLWQVPENFRQDVVNNESQETKLDDPDTPTYIYVFLGAVVFALGDSIWESQPPAILQTYFDPSRTAVIICPNCGQHTQPPPEALEFGCPGCEKTLQANPSEKLDPSAGEAAMANLKMWQSLGFAVQYTLGFALADYFWAKIVVLLSALAISFTFLFYLDRRVAPLDPTIYDDVIISSASQGPASIPSSNPDSEH